MKNIIKIYPTKITINNYNLGDCVNLEKSLSVFDNVIWKVTLEQFIYDEENKILTIPAGYDRYKLKTMFPNYYMDTSEENKVEPYNKTIYSLKFPTRNTMQNEAINFLLKKDTKKFLCLETGGGKTYCAIHYIHRTRKLPMVIVDQDLIANQWKDRILYFTNITEEEIFMIKGKDSINKLIEMSDKDLKKYKFFIAIHRTLNSYDNNDNKYTLHDLFSHLKIGCRLYDEAHIEMRSIFYIDTVYNCESVYITATPSRSNYKENMVYQNSFNTSVISRFTWKSESYHNIVVKAYDSKPSQIDELNMSTKYGFDGNMYCNYVLTNNNAYDVFYDSLKELFNNTFKKTKHKCIILFKTTALCDEMYNAFKDYLESLNNMNITTGEYHYKIKNKEDNLSKDIIFTTDKSMSKAVDIKDLSLVINTVPCTSESLMKQVIGRLRQLKDREVYYIDMYDKGFSKQSKQFNIRLKTYKKISKRIIYLN